jgi:Cdc6-like AAA superfamily ATPase
MDIFIPGILDENIPRRNGGIFIICGPPGSGKTSLLLNFFKKENNLYYQKFDNIYYFCPESSFSSVKDHPFKNHDKIYHELNNEILNTLFDILNSLKLKTFENRKKIKNYKNTKNTKSSKKQNYNILDDYADDSNNLDDDLDTEVKYNCVVIDDMADELKNKEIEKVLKTFLVKARHLNTMFIFNLQSYYYFPKILRKKITNFTLFEPDNYEEWFSISKELFGIKNNKSLELYDYIFDEQYNHLDLNKRNKIFYKNFNKLIFK